MDRRFVRRDEYESDRLDAAAVIAEQRRVMHDEYAGGPGVGPRTLTNADRLATRAARTGVAGVVTSSGAVVRDLAVLDIGAWFKLLFILFVLGLFIAVGIGFWRGGITVNLGTTTVEQQRVAEQEIYGPVRVPNGGPGGP